MKFFAIPALDSGGAEEELNRFLRGHRAVTVRKEMIRHESSAFWSVCVEYIDGAPLSEGRGSHRNRVDYREILSDGDFRLFSKLRERRRVLAEAEAIPVYAVCTNEQLAELARRRVTTLAAFQEVAGLGEAKAAKYGDAFLGVISGDGAHTDEARG